MKRKGPWQFTKRPSLNLTPSKKFFRIKFIDALSRGGLVVCRQSHKLEIVGAIPTPATRFSRCSSMVEQGSHKTETWVQFPPPAQKL